MKHIALFLDGTWNGIDAPHLTNVVKLAERVSDHDGQGNLQMVYYDEGVGTKQAVASKVESWLGGAFGMGLEKNVEQAYRFLVFNYQPGDKIHIFGFSRGAFTARTLAGLIRNCGIIERRHAHRMGEAINLYRSRKEQDHPDADPSCQFRAEFSPRMTVSVRDREWRRQNMPGFDEATPSLALAYLGIWDTVGALGVPAHIPVLSNIFNRRHKFHDAVLSSMVERARHALALDEQRNIFRASPWDLRALGELQARADLEGRKDAYLQQWFPGDHGSVGGGGDITALSDAALIWVADGAREAGLGLVADAYSDLTPDAKGALKNMTPTGKFKPLETLTTKSDREGPEFLDHVSQAARDRWAASANALPEQKLYRPGSLNKVAQALEGT
jgi:uncharacterized protein (DUF2235 family)